MVKGVKKDIEELKKVLAGAAAELAARNLTLGPIGSVSARNGTGVVIRRSGVWLERAERDDFVAVDLDSGRMVKGQKGKPCEGLPFHLALYRAREEVRAIVHSYSRHALAWGMGCAELRACSAGFAASLGESVPVMRYAACGGQEPPEALAAAIGKAPAAILVCNGAVSVGASLDEAILRARLLEQSAAVALLAHARWRTPRYLRPEEAAQLAAPDKTENDSERRPQANAGDGRSGGKKRGRRRR